MPTDIEAEIQAIKLRNASVEAEKAWETSKFRIFTVALLTYLLMILLMYALGIEKPLLSALVPTTGFILSTLSLRLAKNFWIKAIYKKNR